MNDSQIAQGTESSFSFHLPTAIEFGVGSAARLGETLLMQGAKNAFLVTDQGVVRAGLLDRITASLAEHGILFSVFADVEPDPGLETIDAGVERFCSQPYDCIVAVGGGSPIDTAKGIRIVAAHGGNIGAYAGVGRVPSASPIPLVAIPTTSGTGSEVTMFGVYSDWKNHVKVTVTSPHMAPTLAVVDPFLTLSLPAKMTAASGIDALAHGIETYFSVRANPASDALAVQAIQLVAEHLRTAVQNGSDTAGRIGMSKGSLLAGMAFNSGYLGLAHAIGSALSGHCHVPHGVAIGLLLPHVVAFNAAALPRKAEAIAVLLAGQRQPTRSAAEELARLVQEIGLPARLRDVGVPPEKLPEIAIDSFKSGMMKCNPRQPVVEEVVELLQMAY